MLLLLACAPLRDWPVVDGDGVVPEERVSVTPSTLDFGDVSVNSLGSITLSITVSNLGSTEVTVTNHDEPVGSEGFVVEAEPLLTLAAGASVELAVRYAPTTEEQSSALLRVNPGGDVVRLAGSGHAPVAEVGAATVEPTVLGCTGVGEVAVANTGTETLDLSDASVDGSDFTVTGWEANVAPGDFTLVELAFTPGGGGNRGGTLTLSTNDPLRPAVAVSLEGLGYEGERVTEQFEYRPTQPTDIMFLVEPGTFGGDPRLAPALDAYVAALTATNVDFQVTALSTQSPCPSDDPAFATASSTHLGALRVLDRAFDDADGSYDGDLLDLALAAMAQTLDGGCLENFRRAHANLDVVLVADTSPSRDPELQAESLADLLTDPAGLRLSALVPRGGDECPAAAEAYASLAQAYGGVVGDTCDDDWVDVFEGFAQLPAIEAAVVFALAEAPVVDTLDVTVDGAPFTSWTYDAGTNSVTFVAQTAPSLGAAVEITYVLAVACD